MRVNRRNSLICQQVITAMVLVLSGVASQAAGTVVIDFEAAGQPTVVLGSSTYKEDGYVVSSPYSFGVIGYANADDPVAPTGDATLYYSSLNGFSPDLTRADGALFNVISLDVALLPSLPDQVFGGELIFNNAHPDVTTGLVRFRLAASATGHYPFVHIDNLAGIAGFDGQLAFSNLTRLGMFGCMYKSATATACDPQSLTQLAFDNVELGISAVPELSALPLFGAGLFLLSLLTWRTRRAAKLLEKSMNAEATRS